jgi:hypothetical protein
VKAIWINPLDGVAVDLTVPGINRSIEGRQVPIADALFEPRFVTKSRLVFTNAIAGRNFDCSVTRYLRAEPDRPLRQG